MPELPEVHTTVEGLKKVIFGKTITKVWSDFHVGAKNNKGENIKNPKYFAKFKKAVTEAKIKSLERRGKNILINLDNPSTSSLKSSSEQDKFTIIVHMKMTGNLIFRTSPHATRRPLLEAGESVKSKHIHLILTFSDNSQLFLSDIRKFASVDFCKTKDVDLHERIGKLGPDPFDKKLNAKKFFEIIHKKKNWPIKSALLDQRAISGIGNIYSDEILWATNIHPLSKANKVPEKKFGEIFKAMRQILKFSIKKGGDSKTDYHNAFGGKGEFQNFHQAYGLKGKKCPKPRCGGIIEKLEIKGRSSYFCPKHQLIYK